MILADAAEHHALRTGLGHAPARLLAHMARKALDPGNPSGHEPRLYWMARSNMHQALGLAGPDRKPGADAGADAARAWKANESATDRALGALLKAGAVERVRGGAPGRNAVFRVTVQAVDLVDVAVDEATPPGDRHDRQRPSLTEGRPSTSDRSTPAERASLTEGRPLVAAAVASTEQASLTEGRADTGSSLTVGHGSSLTEVNGPRSAWSTGLAHRGPEEERRERREQGREEQHPAPTHLHSTPDRSRHLRPVS